MSGPRILQVLPALNTGGVERGTLDIAQGLVAAGFQSFVASSGGKLVPQLESHGTQHITLPLNTKNPWGILTNAERLAHEITKHNIDLVHARSRGPAWSCVLAAKDRKIPMVTTYHGTYNGGNALKTWYNSVMARGDRVIAISHFIENHIKKTHPRQYDPQKLRMIHRGNDLDVFNPDTVYDADREILRHHWKAEDPRPIILMPGRLTRWKGHETFIEALAIVKSHGISFHGVIVGDHQGRISYKTQLQSMIANHNLMNDVTIAAPTHMMATAYDVARLVVCPSLDPEAFGRTAAEAQAMNRYVIATNHGGALETVQFGTHVPPNDPQALGTAMVKALTDMPACPPPRAYIEQNFSLDIMVHKTLDVYRELLP